LKTLFFNSTKDLNTLPIGLFDFYGYFWVLDVLIPKIDQMRTKGFSIIVFLAFSLTYMNCKQESHHARISKLIGFDIPRGYNLTDYNENYALSFAYSGKLILPDSKVYFEKAELILKKYNEIVFDTLNLKLNSNNMERSKNKNHYIRNKYDIFKENQ
jgi:hypothetical protein